MQRLWLRLRLRLRLWLRLRLRLWLRRGSHADLRLVRRGIVVARRLEMKRSRWSTVRGALWVGSGFRVAHDRRRVRCRPLLLALLPLWHWREQARIDQVGQLLTLLHEDEFDLGDDRDLRA